MIDTIIVKIPYKCLEHSRRGANFILEQLLDASKECGFLDQSKLKERFFSVMWEEILQEDYVLYKSVVKQEEDLYDRSKLFAR